MEINYGHLLALATAVLFSSYSLLSRTLVIRSASPLAFSVAFYALATIFSLSGALVLGFGSFSDVTVTIILVTFLGTLIWAVYAAAQFFARQELEASRFALIFQITPIISFIGGVIVLGDSLTLTKGLAVLLIVTGNMVALLKHGGTVSKRGLLFAFATVVPLGLAYIADKVVVSHYPVWFYSSLIFGTSAIYLAVLVWFREGSFRSIGKEFEIARWKLPLLSVVCVTGYLSMLSAFRIVDLSVAVPIVFTSSIFSTLGGIVILRERGGVPQKLVGAFLVFVGVWLINM